MSQSPSFINRPNPDDPKWVRIPESDRVYNRNLILVVLLIPLAMSLIQVSSVNVALETIGSALRASQTSLQWVLSGYALSFGIFLVPSGRLGDIFGRSGVFTIGLALFTIACTACGFATSPVMLNVFRVLQGMAAGIFSPQVTGIIQQYFQGQARARAFSMFGLVIGASVAVGPLFAGFLIETLGPTNGWRSSFLFNLPLGIIGVIAAFRLLPFGKERRHFMGAKKVKSDASESKTNLPAEQTNASQATQKIDLDPVGIVLLSLAVLCIMLPFMSHGHPLMWSLIPLAIILTVVWIWWENRYKRHGHFPMVDLSLFKLKSFSYCAAISATQFLGTTSLFVIFAMYLQAGLGQSALVAGSIGIPNAIVSALAALWSGKHALKSGRQVQILALSFLLLGVITLIGTVWAVNAGASFWWMCAPLMLFGFGQGAMGAANQTQAMLDVPVEHGGIAGGITQTAQRITTAIGNAVMTAVFFAVVGNQQTASKWDWSMGISAAYVLTASILAVALVIAIVYWWDLAGKRPRNRK